MKTKQLLQVHTNLFVNSEAAAKFMQDIAEKYLNQEIKETELAAARDQKLKRAKYACSFEAALRCCDQPFAGRRRAALQAGEVHDTDT